MDIMFKRIGTLDYFIGLLIFCSIILIATMVGMLSVLSAVIIFILLIFISYLYTDIMLCFTVFSSILIPIDLSVKGEGLFRIGPMRVIMAAFIIGFILKVFINKTKFSLKWHFPLIGYALFYIASGIIGSVFSIDRLRSIFAVIGRDIIEQFVMFYIFIFLFRRYRCWIYVKNTLFICTAFVCVLGFYETITFSNPLIKLFYNQTLEFREGILRIRSTFFHPIALGCFLNIVFPFVIVDLINIKLLSRKIMLFILIIIMLITSFMTVSRGPWICLGLEISIFIIWWGTKNIKNTIFGIVIFVIILFIMVLVYGNNDKSAINRLFKPLFSPQQQQETSPEYYRVMLFDSVVNQMHGAKWIYGYGPNAFDLSDVEGSYEGKNYVLTSPDNHYVRILFEYGMTGLILFCILLISSMHTCFYAIRNVTSDHEKLLAVGCFASVLGFALVNITASMFQIYPLGMLYWMGISVAINLGRRNIINV